VNRAIELSLVVASTIISTAAIAQQAAAPTPDPKPSSSATAPLVLHIDSQPMDAALQEFGRQSHLQVVYPTEVVDVALVAPALTGEYQSPGAALDKLLKGSGLQYRFVNPETVAIRPAQPAERGGSKASFSPTSSSGQAFDADRGDGSMRLAQAESAATASYGPPAEQRDASGLEEVVVTAQKRSERLQDVPVPVSVIDAQHLTENSQVLLRDYYSSVPGLDVTPNSSAGAQTITIRGIQTGFGAADTVAVLIDDVPTGDSFGASERAIDLDPSDLDHIEVLRGPQGTLYGASSMGGLIKFVSKDPTTDKFSGRLEGGTSTVHNGPEPGFSLRGSMNIPVSDTLALRVSGYDRQDPGFIDELPLHLAGVNRQDVLGGRLTALWRPAEGWSLKVAYLYQRTVMNGSDDAEIGAGLGDLQQNYYRIPGFVGAGHRTSELLSAVLRGRVAGVDITSITGYGYDYYRDTEDLTAFTTWSNYAQTTFGLPGAGYDGFRATHYASEELRFSGELWSKFDWIVGGLYTRARSLNGDEERAVSLDGQIDATSESDDYTPYQYREWAGFADLTYHVTDRFSVQVGGRVSSIHTEEPGLKWYGPWVPFFEGVQSNYYVGPPGASSATPLTYLFTPSYKLTPNLMVYARLASGYRVGQPNSFTGVYLGNYNAPPFAKPDTTENYELGIKGDFLDRVLSVDASLYYIDWKSLQLTAFSSTGSFAYTTNGGNAKSEGVEFSLTARPVLGLTLSGWVDYDNAVLTTPFPASATAYGRPGYRLPFSAKWSGNVSAQDDFALPGHLTGFVGGQFSIVGERVSYFQATPQRTTYPAYTKTDLRVGVKNDEWTLNVYVNNAADVRGVVNSNYYPPNSRIYITPRTIGLTVARNF